MVFCEQETYPVDCSTCSQRGFKLCYFTARQDQPIVMVLLDWIIVLVLKPRWLFSRLSCSGLSGSGLSCSRLSCSRLSWLSWLSCTGLPYSGLSWQSCSGLSRSGLSWQSCTGLPCSRLSWLSRSGLSWSMWSGRSIRTGCSRTCLRSHRVRPGQLGRRDLRPHRGCPQ